MTSNKIVFASDPGLDPGERGNPYDVNGRQKGNDGKLINDCMDCFVSLRFLAMTLFLSSRTDVRDIPAFGTRFLNRMRSFGMTLLLLFTVLCLLPSSAHAQCTPPSDGLAGHWTLDEASGSLIDSAGTNNGTQSGGIEYASAGVIGNAAGFDGIDDSVQVSNSYTSTASTLSFWFKAQSQGQDRILVTNFQDSSNAWNISIDSTDNIEIDEEFGGVGTTHYSTAVAMGEWHHVVGVIDSGNEVLLYLDGQLIGSGNTIGGNFSNLSSGNLYFAERGNATQYYKGALDDVRIYNRALSAAEIEALYATRSTADAPEGFMFYDTRHARMAYCNGTDWVHAGTGSYNPNAVEFDGTDYLDQTSALSSVTADGKTVTGSFWFRRTGGFGSRQRIYRTNDGDFEIRFLNTNQFYVAGDDPSGSTEVLNIQSSGAITDSDWHHVMFSVDMSDPAKRHLYVDDADVISVVTYIDSPIEMTNTGRFGATGAGTETLQADIADFWLDFETYIDLSAKANRRRFIAAGGLPMYLGPDGSIPTGSQPDIFLSGDTANWPVNKGAGGGGLSVAAGALSYSSSQPGDTLVSSGSVATGLVGYWKLDETTGTSVTDSSGNGNDGSMQNGLTADSNSVPGQIGTAIEFDNNNDYITITNESNFDFDLSDPFTISAWVYRNNNSTEDDIVEKVVPASYDGYGLYFSAGDTLVFVVNNGSNGMDAQATADVVGGWHHIVAVYNGTDAYSGLKLYLDGQELSVSNTGPNGIGGTILNDQNVTIGIDDEADTCCVFDGAIDDVRIYNRELTADDAYSLYKSGIPGKLQYNTDFNVMEYFNGAEWVAMGPVGGTPPTSGLVGHWKLDETTGTNAADSAGTAQDGVWEGEADIREAGGKIDGGFEFDGTDDLVQIADHADLDITGAITLAAWIYPDSVSGNQEVINKKSDSLASGYRLKKFAANIQFEFSDGVTTQLITPTTGSPIQADRWQHVVATYDLQTVRIYVDGVDVPVTQQDRTETIATNNTPLRIGGYATEAAYWFDGKIDDARIYNRALSAQEVSQLYMFGLSGGLGDVSADCANPSMPEGSMVYNIDYNVMQYCNGEEWVGIGK